MHLPFIHATRKITVVIICAILSVSSSCLSNSPDAVVKQFYKYLNHAEYSKAKELYTTGAKQVLAVQLPLEEQFNTWAEYETKQGTIEDLKITNVQTRGEGATVQYSIIYKDGSVLYKSVSLTLENGSWKLGLIPDGVSG